MSHEMEDTNNTVRQASKVDRDIESIDRGVELVDRNVELVDRGVELVDRNVELVEGDAPNSLPQVLPKPDRDANTLRVGTASAANLPAKVRAEEVALRSNQTSMLWWPGIVLSFAVFFLTSRGDSQPFIAALFGASAYWSYCIYRLFARYEPRPVGQLPARYPAILSMGGSPAGIAGLMLVLDVLVLSVTEMIVNTFRSIPNAGVFALISIITLIGGVGLLVVPFLLTYRWYFIVCKNVLLSRSPDGSPPSNSTALAWSFAIATAICGPNLCEILLFLITRQDYSTILPMNYFYGSSMMIAFVIAIIAEKKRKQTYTADTMPEIQKL